MTLIPDAAHPAAQCSTPRRWLRQASALLLLSVVTAASHGDEAAAAAMSEAPAFSPEVAAALQPYQWQAEASPPGTSDLAGLREHLRVAIGDQPRLQRQLAREQEAVLQIDEARAERRPQISLGLEQRNSLRDVDRRAFDRGSRVDAVASISQLLFDFGASGQRVRSARHRSEAERWQSRDDTEQIMLDALEAYYDVLRHRVQIQLAEDNLLQHERILADVKDRLAAGAGSRADVLRAQSRIADARAQLVNLEGQLARASNAYVELFGAEPEWLELPILPGDLATEEVNTALLQAMEENSALNRSLSERDASAAAARAERNSRFPRLSLALQGRQFDVDDRAETDTDLTVMVNLEYDLYTGGAASSRVGQAEARLHQASYERAALQRELENRLRSSHTDVLTREQSWQAQSLAVDADREALEAYRAQFALGRRTLTDLLDAQRDLFQAAVALIDQRIDWDLARFTYLYAAGSLLPTLDVEIPASGAQP